jgi:hypothetical protein
MPYTNLARNNIAGTNCTMPGGVLNHENSRCTLEGLHQHISLAKRMCKSLCSIQQCELFSYNVLSRNFHPVQRQSIRYTVDLYRTFAGICCVFRHHPMDPLHGRVIDSCHLWVYNLFTETITIVGLYRSWNNRDPLQCQAPTIVQWLPFRGRDMDSCHRSSI